MLYADGLPFKVKEHLFREHDYHIFTLQKTMAEAKRHNNVNSYMNKGRGPPPGDRNKDAGNAEQKGDSKGGDNKDDKQATFKRRANLTTVAGLWDRCYMIYSEPLSR